MSGDGLRDDTRVPGCARRSCDLRHNIDIRAPAKPFRAFRGVSLPRAGDRAARSIDIVPAGEGLRASARSYLPLAPRPSTGLLRRPAPADCHTSDVLEECTRFPRW